MPHGVEAAKALVKAVTVEEKSSPERCPVWTQSGIIRVGRRDWIQRPLVLAESFSIPYLAVSSLTSMAAAFSIASRSALRHSSGE
jgi:hypothetical protein